MTTAREVAKAIVADARMRLIAHKPEYDSVDMGEALITNLVDAALSLAKQEGGELAELAKHPNWEISCQPDELEDEGDWRVHEVRGGINDREWTEIGRGQTPQAAIRAALSPQEGK